MAKDEMDTGLEGLDLDLNQQEQKQQLTVDEYELTSFPTTMSCSQAFDQLYQCFSVGGQFRNVYRYGEMNACRDKRYKMKFCLMAKLQDEEEQKRRFARYYKEELAKKQAQKGSSENIWSRREQPLQSPFLEE